MTLPTAYTSTHGPLKHTQFLLICMQARFGPPHSNDRAKNEQSCTKLAADNAEEGYDSQGHNPFMVRHARVWSRASTDKLVPGGSTVA